MKKPVGNDVRLGVYTMPILLALHGSYGDELRAMLGAPIADVAEVAAILDLVKAAGTVDQTLQAAQDYNVRASAALDALPGTAVTEGLARLPEAYLDWALARNTDGGCALPAST
jgi:geranylgeranyl pyrophosphate synthase